MLTKSLYFCNGSCWCLYGIVNLHRHICLLRLFHRYTTSLALSFSTLFSLSKTFCVTIVIEFVAVKVVIKTFFTS